MLSLSWSELAIIALVIILLIGPKDVPVVIKNLRSMWSKLQQMKNDVGNTMRDIANEADPDHMLKDYADEINNDIKRIVDLEGNVQETYPIPDIKRAEKTEP